VSAASGLLELDRAKLLRQVHLVLPSCSPYPGWNQTRITVMFLLFSFCKFKKKMDLNGIFTIN
jgi:hypothetical protein